MKLTLAWTDWFIDLLNDFGVVTVAQFDHRWWISIAAAITVASAGATEMTIAATTATAQAAATTSTATVALTTY